MWQKSYPHRNTLRCKVLEVKIVTKMVQFHVIVSKNSRVKMKSTPFVCTVSMNIWSINHSLLTHAVSLRWWCHCLTAHTCWHGLAVTHSVQHQENCAYCISNVSLVK